MKNSLETRIGIFVALVVLAAVFILDIIGGPDKFRRGLHMVAFFNNVQELKVGDRVKMAGVEIGRVEGITLSNNQVMVSIKVRKDGGVRTTSKATIKFAGLMGQNYVSIDFGAPSGGPAEDGFNIPTTEQPDLSTLMAKLDNVAGGVERLTQSFTGDKIDNLLGPFTDFLKANKDPLTATIANVRAISSQISSGQGTVGKLIYDQSLFNSTFSAVTNIQSAGDEAKLTIANARRVIDEVNSGQGTIGKLVKDPSLYNETTSSMTNMRQILEKINQGQGTIGKLVNDQEFYKNAKLSLQKIDKGVEGLEDQGPLSVLGIVVNSLL